MAEIRYPVEWAALKIPQWRLELLATLKELADPDYQRRAWIEKTLDKDTIVGAGQVYHSLFEDLDLASAPGEAIGAFLFDAAELAALSPLIAHLEAVWADVGDPPDSAACLAHPDWPKVVAAAASARAALAARGNPTGGG